MSAVKILAHRCGPARGAENTLEGAAAALRDGADSLEVDVRLTADGEPVLFHDDDAGRLTGRAGPVRALSWTDLRRLRVLGAYAVPHLDELLSWLAARPKVECFIDFHENDERLVSAVARRLEAGRAWGNTYLLAFWTSNRLLRLAKKIDGRIRTAVMPQVPWRMAERCAALGVSAACVGWDQRAPTRHLFQATCVLADLPGEVRRTEAAGIAVSGGVANTPEQVEWFVARGIRSIWSDDVVMARAVAEKAAGGILADAPNEKGPARGD